MTDAQLYNFDLVHGKHQKDIVVLVVDLVNSSSLRSHADATTWRAQYDNCMPVILAVVTRYNGRVVKFPGDGFPFAFPPFERDPEDDALRAAVAIQRELDKLREEREIDAKMQVRVSAGIVNASVVNWKVGVVEGGRTMSARKSTRSSASIR
ncbi:hypothetical protein [Stagnihabitans tardus]|uniref:Guanylate cyclase domain-containing protein n=1 Tax=Stagnihabitans tardus TaxID=2699202 RepID=A0AAE4YC14_9RHOB|nr:hypothetical protein [Stagnihabitans tardus]NBZ88493.1 hypothetical protein [Stagnihabitans tardus]